MRLPDSILEKAKNELTELLAKQPDQEQAFQTFFERNSFAIPLPHLIGHHVQFSSVITKLPIDTSLICDFCYITRHSSKTWIVLVEIESPAKRIFTADHKFLKRSAECTEAFAQVETWKDYLKRNKDALLNRLKPLLKPDYILKDPIEIKYVLLYGRRTEFETDIRRLDRYRSFTTDDIAFWTYESIISNLETHRDFLLLNVLRLEGQRYTFKYMHELPAGILSWLSPGEFFVSKKHRDILMRHFYEIEPWEAGKLLKFNDLYADMNRSLSGGHSYFEQSHLYHEGSNFDPATAFEE
jgi:hypothetical protein